MGGLLKHIRAIAIALALALALSLIGCTEAGDSEPPASEEFAEIVARADEALEAGDPKQAFDLYAEALGLDGENDPDGSVTEKQEQAKHLFLAQGLLESTNEFEIKHLVAVIVEHPTAEAEVAEAKGRLAQFIRDQRDALSDDVASVRAQVVSGEAYKEPYAAAMADGLGETWMRSVDRIEGGFGEAAQTAMVSLLKAADQASMCVTRDSRNEALNDLDAAAETLAGMDAELAALVEAAE